MRKMILSVMIFAIFSIAAAIFFLLNRDNAHAAPSCTGWMKQTNGCYERVCVSDTGQTYCEQSCNNIITRINCRR